MEQKVCSKCEIEKDINNFSFRTDTNKYRNQCKLCMFKRDKEYKEKNKEKIIIYQSEYRQINKEQLALKKKEYEDKNKEAVKKRRHEYFIKNKEYLRKKQNEYEKHRMKTDINFKLVKKTRSRIRDALKGNLKSSSTKDILGIDIETYKRWIEWQMIPEMDWNNIQIDHVKPICMFDVSKDEELKEAFNWRNTQPLLKEDNLKKGSKYNELDYRLQFIKAYQFSKLNEQETR